MGVDGTDAERQDAASDFGGHALALTLMGSYLKRVYGGDIRKHHEIPRLYDDQKQGAHARRVLQSYEHWLAGKPELDILRMMGLFDRPADGGAVQALKAKREIKGLTSNLQHLTSSNWQFAIANLRDLRLLAAPDADDADRLDCHPLVREHFAEQLQRDNPAAWREGNSRLYEYYKTTAKQLPDTIQEMAPLFAAVLHGCQAGNHQAALDEVYWKRINRGQEAFNAKKLGAIGSELAALSGFFDGASWRKPVDGLREDAKGFILNEAGFDLRALGRLAEAAQPMQAGLELRLAQKRWLNAAIIASNLSELWLTIGDVPQALGYAQQSVELADRSGDAFQRMVNRTTYADALHQAGRLAEAESAFRQAEEMQKQSQPEFPLLYSVQGYQYCDLLLSQGNYAEVQRRASQTLDWLIKYGQAQGSTTGLLDIALDNLALGRAHLLQSQRDPNHPIAQSPNFLTRAVDGLRESGNQDDVPRGLLARAEYFRVTGAWEKAKRDVDEAFGIATRGGMGLHLADCHLGYARLALAEADRRPKTEDRQPLIGQARKHLDIASKRINEMGYHRRDKEVQELEKQMSQLPNVPRSQ
jgi:tetratricopeptide (TPR) repeat protein